jgi:serine/threonine protein kinase
MAPEIVREEKYDEKVDVWSVGVIAYILISGRPPFRGKNKNEIFESIKHHDVTFDHEIWTRVSPEAKDFIRRALVKNKNDRASAKDLIDHEWIRKQVKSPEIEH